MRRDDPQNRGTGEHHCERDQGREQSLAQGPDLPLAHRDPCKARKPFRSLGRRDGASAPGLDKDADYTV